MANEIVNRVANSALVTLDIESFYPSEPRLLLDIKPWLWEGLILKEKEFRATLKEFDWEQFRDKHVAVLCSSDAIVPSWAYMLISSYLTPVTKVIQQGNLLDLEQAICNHTIEQLDLEQFRDKPVIIKGCSTRKIPENAYVQLTKKIQPIAKSVLFGEACSSVPIYKRPK